jgi:predicted LPLAT superfamily acyltransferase
MTEDWRQQKERASPFWLNLIVFMATHMKRAHVRIVLYPTVAYFLLTGGKARKASDDYLQRALGRKPTWRDTWRHFFSFASCTLDRIYLLSLRTQNLQMQKFRSAAVAEIAARASGCLLFVAHFGSVESMRVDAIERGRLPLSIVLDRQHGRMLMELLERLSPEIASSVIDAAATPPQLALSIKEALQRGRMVAFSVDRTLATERSVAVDFLGGRAQLPVGPWQMAAVMKVPVILGFGVYEGGNRYSVYLELFDETITLPRQQRDAAIAEYAQRYAQRLEHYARLAPYNWFNFYDYWLSDDAAAKSTHEVATS